MTHLRTVIPCKVGKIATNHLPLSMVGTFVMPHPLTPYRDLCRERETAYSTPENPFQ